MSRARAAASPDSPTVMAQQELPNSEIDVQRLLVQLEAEERELSRVRRRLFDRIDIGFEGEHTERLRAQERDVSRRRRELHARIDALRAQRDLLAMQRQLGALSADIEANPPDGHPLPLEETKATP